MKGCVLGHWVGYIHQGYIRLHKWEIWPHGALCFYAMGLWKQTVRPSSRVWTRTYTPVFCSSPFLRLLVTWSQQGCSTSRHGPNIMSRTTQAEFTVISLEPQSISVFLFVITKWLIKENRSCHPVTPSPASSEERSAWRRGGDSPTKKLRMFCFHNLCGNLNFK